jgi:hypothetical protein
MSKITKVPNGPLIKKKGPFKGSTLKTGGTIKKAQAGAVMTKRDSTVANIKEQARLRQNLKDFQKKAGSKPLTPELVREKDSLKGLLKDFSTKQRVKGTGLTEQQLAKNDSIYTAQERKKKSEVDDSGQLRCIGNDKPGCSGSQAASERRVRREARRRNGGPIKKAKAGAMIKRAQNGESFTKDGNEYTYTKQVTRPEGKRKYEGKSKDQATAMKIANFKIRNNPSDSLRTVKPVIKKNGGMIKRADGSMSRRGLWDNIRANKGSGKKPTKQMLVQEKKIKAKSKK